MKLLVSNKVLIMKPLMALVSFKQAKWCFFLCSLICSISFSSYAQKVVYPLSNDISSDLITSIDSDSDGSDTVDMLNKMREAVQNSDYKLYFVTQNENENPKSYEYTYIGSQSNKKGDLLYLEGSSKEIILHDNIVSHFLTDSASFSIGANHIVEAFPDVIYNNFDSLTPYYDFINLGKARMANRSSQLIRIVPKDKDRYNYVIWIDDQNYLPLRIDLLDLDAKIISQTKVILVDFNFDKQQFANYIADRDYPILFPIDKQVSHNYDWQASWIPKGFKEINAYSIDFHNVNIDTRRFSDGIFSFTINISPRSLSDITYLSVQGDRTIYSTNYGKQNVIVIGNLPAETIKQIAHNLKLK